MTALDTNILVYAHRPEMPFHKQAKEFVGSLAEGREPWALPWPAIHEFLAVVSHPRIFVNPTAISEALLQVSLWLSSPSAFTITETERYFPVLQSLLEQTGVAGPKIHDARIAAICVSNGVTTLFSADRDFSRFGDALAIRNPFLGSPA